MPSPISTILIVAAILASSSGSSVVAALALAGAAAWELVTYLADLGSRPDIVYVREDGTPILREVP
jgi:hypothetical protein